jgi:hypothetical protein
MHPTVTAAMLAYYTDGFSGQPTPQDRADAQQAAAQAVAYVARTQPHGMAAMEQWAAQPGNAGLLAQYLLYVFATTWNCEQAPAVAMGAAFTAEMGHACAALVAYAFS